MGVADAPLIDLFDEVRSWAYRGVGGLSLPSTDFAMDENVCKICGECELSFTNFCPKFKCRGCGIWLCGSCVRRSGTVTKLATAGGMENSCHLEKIIKSCKFCIRKSKRYSEKIYPSDSPRGSPEPLSPCSDGEKVCNETNVKRIYGGANGTVEEGEQDLPLKTTTESSSFTPSTVYTSPISVRCFPIRSDEETEECGNHFFIPSSEYYHDSSDVDTKNVSFRHDCCSYKSGGSSPSDSPSRVTVNPPRVGHPISHEEARNLNSQFEFPSNQEVEAVLAKHEEVTRAIDPSDSSNKDMPHMPILHIEKKVKKHLDFVNNNHMWLPPPAEDEDDDKEDDHFEYDDDDDEIGDSRGMFSSSGDVGKLVLRKKHSEEQKEPLKSAVHCHFRALVSQLLQGEGIKFTMDDESEDWLTIITNLAWQAANYVKPHTSKEGSMDPGAYVKIKCIASGKPEQSALVKGVVCTKNIKHKRMTSWYKHPKLLLLGGSLEYQRSSSELASFSTLLEEEINHLRIFLSRIEAHQPNVLLVERSVSPYAQEYLLANEISLVLNVKRHLLERIARCTGASITHADSISSARIGHCEVFHLEKVSEELKGTNQSEKRSSKTLMFFDGCPRRLGCTILLRGSCRDELKKLKHVTQYAVFAAYHLSLETSFLADEGASLPKMTLQSSSTAPDSVITAHTDSPLYVPAQPVVDMPVLPGLSLGQCVEADGLLSTAKLPHLTPITFPMDDKSHDISDGFLDGQISVAAVDSGSFMHHDYNFGQSGCPCDVINSLQTKSFEALVPGAHLPKGPEGTAGQVSNEYFSIADSNQSILVSFSSRCVTKGVLCERSRLLRIKFYGSFDKPLGKYLREDLFEPVSNCPSCQEPVEAHVQCYIHQQGSLTINVRPLSSHKLSGHQDGKIWMWHRCLRCPDDDGVPPSTRRVVMSDAAWGLSFGKFLELSFSNHATANRIASCGHSLQRDCLRFYGCGDMVAFFHYSPIDILSVRLPTSLLEFDGQCKREWLKKEASELTCRMETTHTEIINVLNYMEQRSMRLHYGPSDYRDMSRHILALKDLLSKEKSDFYELLQQDSEDNSCLVQKEYDILELNNLRNSLLISSRVWEYRFYSLDSILRSWTSTSEALKDASLCAELCIDLSSKEVKPVNTNVEPELNASQNYDASSSLAIHCDGINLGREVAMGYNSSESAQSPVSNLSDKIDSVWTGMVQQPLKSHISNLLSDDSGGGTNLGNAVHNLPCKRLTSMARVCSFDSATRLRERLHRSSLPSSHLSTVRSFRCAGDLRTKVGDPMSDLIRTHSQISPREAQKLSSILSSPPTYISSSSHTDEGPRLLLPHPGRNNLVIGVYDDEPTSIISYALSSKDHDDWVCNKFNDFEGSSVNDISGEEFTTSSISPWPSFGSVDLESMSYGSEDASPRIGSLFYSSKRSSHLRVSFEDDSIAALGKAKFSVTCYFAKQFDMLRRKCCSNEIDFVRSLSRCKKWSAQGGKSNVYFAKSMDDRFIVKQVTKTELDSFEEFAPNYFKYLTESLNSGSPTCLAKVLGIYQVSVKNIRGGKETKMDLMVMENLFFERNISKIYDLKGSSRSRYNPDTLGANKVHLDMNLLEALRTNPIFLGSNAKRSLERAVWNDTSFLASIDVMDYSLLVGVDEERKELVLGIIDFMRQYTWDKQLETWVKASGILGGTKNAEPTIISPKQYKRRFRKAMTTYFFRVPDQWSS